MRRSEAVRLVVLPGGFIDDGGRVHAEVDLAVPTGAAEEAVLNAPPETCAAALTTTLLAHTVRRVGTMRRVSPAVVGELIVQDREFLLIRLRELMLGPDMWVRVNCPHGECGHTMEVKLQLDALPIVSRPITSRYVPYDETIEFRLPTGADQERIAAAANTEESAIRQMLARCLRRRDGDGAVDVSRLSSAAVADIEARMQMTAPDVATEMDAICPDCRRAFVAEVDLPFLILSELRAATRRLEDEVHVLAWNYHWAEAEILAMSRPKRARYVRLIEEQLDRLAAV